MDRVMNKLMEFRNPDSEGSRGAEAQSTDPKGRDDNVQVQLKGKNTFVVPKTVRSLGWTNKDKPKTKLAQEGEDEKPKSNDEFRKMLLKN